MNVLFNQHTYQVYQLQIPKGKGKYRTIFAPDEQLNCLLKIIATKLQIIEPQYEYAHGFVKQRSPVTNAMAHTGFRYSLSMDIKDFFPSVKPHHLADFYNRIEPIIKPELLFINNSLPQGFPTSPILSNLAMIPVDNTIAEQLKQLNQPFSFTRYADDITVSFNEITLLQTIKNIITDTLQQYGFAINPKKTLLQDGMYRRRIITGVAIEKDKIFPPRLIKRKIRAAKHNNQKRSLGGLIEWSKLNPPKPHELLMAEAKSWHLATKLNPNIDIKVTRKVRSIIKKLKS